MLPHGYFYGKLQHHFHSMKHFKMYKIAWYNKNTNAFANLLAISFPQAGKQNATDASPDDFTLMSIIYAIYLIRLYNIDHHKHRMFHSLSANWSMILEVCWAWNHCIFDGLPSNPGKTNKICDHNPCLPWFINILQVSWVSSVQAFL